MNTVKDYLKSYRTSMAKVQRIKNIAAAHGISEGNAEKEILVHLKTATEIEDFISCAENFIQREVLTRKYIYGETNEQIAESMNYSTRHVARLANSAVNSLEKVFENMAS